MAHVISSVGAITMISSLSLLILTCGIVPQLALSADPMVRKFPDGFLFGAGTAAYQVEGAVTDDGKTETIWDHLAHTEPCAVHNCSNARLAADSYHQYKRDVQMMRELGLNYYSFSLSWARILPNSFSNEVNQDAIDYYNNLINEMIKYNIQPVVTLYHWDLPQKLENFGGWTNPNIVMWFADYAHVAFKHFGDRVKYWITINDPLAVCHHGYGLKVAAPRLDVPGIAEYDCTKNVLMAHAEAYHIYDNLYRLYHNGSIGIAVNAIWYEPATVEDIDAADEAQQFIWGQYTDPIFSLNGDFPDIMKYKVAAKSAMQGFKRSRLPRLCHYEIERIRGSADFFGLNHFGVYMAHVNKSDANHYIAPSLHDDIGVITYQRNSSQINETHDRSQRDYFLKLLSKIRNLYNNIPIMITGAGLATEAGLNDQERVEYHRVHLDLVLDAIAEGIHVTGYTAWSLMDGFEWMSGYSKRFGLYEVDFNDSTRPRTPRKSAFVYKEIVRTRSIDPAYNPDTAIMSIDIDH